MFNDFLFKVNLDCLFRSFSWFNLLFRRWIFSWFHNFFRCNFSFYNFWLFLLLWWWLNYRLNYFFGDNYWLFNFFFWRRWSVFQSLFCLFAIFFCSNNCWFFRSNNFIITLFRWRSRLYNLFHLFFHNFWLLFRFVFTLWFSFDRFFHDFLNRAFSWLHSWLFINRSFWSFSCWLDSFLLCLDWSLLFTFLFCRNWLSCCFRLGGGINICVVWLLLIW